MNRPASHLFLGEILDESHVLTGMKNRTKKSAIEDLVDVLWHKGSIEQKSEAVKRVLEREDLVTTALGEGVAIPHARLEVGEKPLIAVGRHEEGIDFEAPDGKKVNLIFLVLWQPEKPGLFNRLFSGLVSKIADANFRSQLLKAKNAKEIAGSISDVKVDFLAGSSGKWETDMLITLQLLESKHRAGAKGLSKKIELARAELPGSLLSRFDRLIKFYGEALVEATGGVCGGCNMALSTGLAQELLRNRDSIYVCERCGRFIVNQIS